MNNSCFDLDSELLFILSTRLGTIDTIFYPDLDQRTPLVLKKRFEKY